MTIGTIEAGTRVSRRLVGAGVVATSVAGLLAWLWLGMVLAKISSSLRKVEGCLSPTRVNGVLGWGSWSGDVKSLAGSMVASSEDMVCIE